MGSDVERTQKMNSRAKGARGEREVAKILRDRGYGDARRSVQYCGANGDADVIGLPGVHLEIKRVERLNLEDAMQQSRTDAREDELPVVVHKKNHKKWLCTMEFNDFLDLIEKSRRRDNSE